MDYPEQNIPLLSLRGARHYYRLEGDPALPGVALVHPIGADQSLWDGVVPYLLRHFQVLRHDLRGHGGSEATPGEYDIDLLAGDLLAIASELGWDKFAACGMSIGGMTALKAAAKAPQRIRSLVVCSAAPRMHTPPGGWDLRALTARETGMISFAAPMIERMFTPAFRERGDPMVETLRTVFSRMDPEGYASSIAVLRDADLGPDLSSIRARTLVASGKSDSSVPVAARDALLKGLANSSFCEFEAGHCPPIETPMQFADAVVRHVRMAG